MVMPRGGPMTALVLDQVTKSFGAKRAVDALSFSVADGQVFGFLGGNGAGKTTSLRMVLDIIRPDGGTIQVLGRAPGRENAREIGFLPEERGLYRSMTAIDTITYFGRLKGMTTADARHEGKALLERFGLGAEARTKVEKLSKGMEQKVQLAAAIVNAPRLVILDEPFSGLDPVNQGLLEDEVLRLARSGATVIFSTHVMQHAERLCDRLLLIARGKKIFEGTQEEARGALPARLSIVSRASPMGMAGVADAQPEGLADAEGWQRWRVALAPGAEPAGVLEAFTQSGFALRRFDEQRPSLHDVFIQLVGPQEMVA